MTSLDLLGQLSQHWDVDLDKSLIDTVISRPPFVRIDGTFNARYITSDLDNSANVHDPESVNPLSIKPGYIYRGAVLSYLTEEGKAKIRDLGIKTIFDLRSDKERERDPEPEVEGVESRWFPSTKDEITLPSAIAAASGSARFEDLYLHFLQTHKNVYRAVFEHIRDQPGIPFMFHCMGGKDRTGVLSALILYIAGTPIETMTLDYLLTRAGLEPAKHHLTKLIQQKNNGTDLNDPRVKAWADLPPDAMVKFISRAETEVEGGLDGYFRHQLGLSDQDLTKIRNTLRGSQGQL